MSKFAERILIASDLEEGQNRVLQAGMELARGLGAKVWVVHAIEPLGQFAHSLIDSYVPEDTLADLDAGEYGRIRENLQKRLEEISRKADGEAGLLVEARTVEGMPAQVVLDESERINAELVVLGSRGHSAIGEMLLGSVAHRVSMKTRVPLLLIPILPQN